MQINIRLTDLLVGAPLYTVKKDEGRVYVYLNKKVCNQSIVRMNE